MAELKISINNQEVGTVFLDEDTDQFNLVYSPEWVKAGYAISPHIPLSGSAQSAAVRRFLENLLPEGKGLDDIVAYTHISKNNIFSLIKSIGHETSGAVMFGLWNEKTEFREISEEELSQRIKDRENKSIVIWDGKERLSLAGVQEKLPVIIKDGKFGLGEGNLASTHILKFQNKRDIYLVINEYFCMILAKESGLNVAPVELRKFDDEPVLIVERFDRILEDNKVTRKHVIDGCQMLNLPHSYKYERNHGSGRDVMHIREGASFKKLFDALQECKSPSKAALDVLDWSLFNLLIGNSDAHAKNISFMVNKNGIEVAPIYDVLSIVMHDQVEHDLAMAFGAEFKHDGIRAFQLREFSEDIGLDPKLISKRITFITNKVEKALNTITINNALLTDDELKFIKRLSETIARRCKALRESAKEMMDITFD